MITESKETVLAETKVEASKDYQIRSIPTPNSKLGLSQAYPAFGFPRSVTGSFGLASSSAWKSVKSSVVAKGGDHEIQPSAILTKGAEIIRQWASDNITQRFLERRRAIVESQQLLEQRHLIKVPDESVAARKNLFMDIFGLKIDNLSIEKVLDTVPTMMESRESKVPENSVRDEYSVTNIIEPELGNINTISKIAEDAKPISEICSETNNLAPKIYSESEIKDLFLNLIASVHRCDHILAGRLCEILQSKPYLAQDEDLFPSKKSSLIYFPSQNQPLQQYYNSYGRTVCWRAPKLQATPQLDILLSEVGSEDFMSIGMSKFDHERAIGILGFLIKSSTPLRSIGWSLARFLWVHSPKNERKMIWDTCEMKALEELTEKKNLFGVMRFLSTVSMTYAKSDEINMQDQIISVQMMNVFVQLSSAFIGIEEKSIGRYPPEWRFGCDGEALLEFSASVITMLWRWVGVPNTEEYRPLFSATLLTVFNLLTFPNIGKLYEPYWVQHVLQNGEIFDLILKSNPLQSQGFLRVLKADRLIGRSLLAKAIFCKSLKECMVEQGLYKHVIPLFESAVYQQDNVALFAHLVKDFMRVNPSHHLDTQKKLKEALQAQKDFSGTIEERKLQHLYCIPFMRSVEFETNSLFGCFEDVIQVEKDQYKEFRAVKTDLEKIPYLLPIVGSPTGKLVAVKSLVGQSRLAEKFPNVPKLNAKLPTQALVEVDISFDGFAGATSLDVNHPDCQTHVSKLGKMIWIGRQLYFITLAPGKSIKSKHSRLVIKKLHNKSAAGRTIMDLGVLRNDENFQVWQPAKNQLVIGILEKDSLKLKSFDLISVPRFLKVFSLTLRNPAIYTDFFKTDSGIIGVWLDKPCKSGPYVGEDTFSILITKLRKTVTEIPAAPQIYSIAACGSHLAYAGPYSVNLLRIQGHSVYPMQEYKLLKGMPYTKLIFVSPNILACAPLYEGEIAVTLIKVTKSRIAYLNYPHNKPVDFNLDRFPPKNLLDQFLSSERTCLHVGFDKQKTSIVQVFYSEEKTNPQSLAGAYSSHPPKKYANMTKQEILERVQPTKLEQQMSSTPAAQGPVAESTVAAESQTSKAGHKPKTRSSKPSSSSNRKKTAEPSTKESSVAVVKSEKSEKAEKQDQTTSKVEVVAVTSGPKESLVGEASSNGTTVKVVVRAFSSPLVAQWIWDQY